MNKITKYLKKDFKKYFRHYGCNHPKRGGNHLCRRIPSNTLSVQKTEGESSTLTHHKPKSKLQQTAQIKMVHLMFHFLCNFVWMI